MSFADYSQQIAQQGGSQGNSLVTLYSLTIDGNVGNLSPQITATFPPNQTPMYGFYEIVWFLTKLQYAPVFKYHKGKDEREKILCAKTFPEFSDCPACNAYEYYKTIHGNDKDRYPVKAQQQIQYLPVYVPRRAQYGHVRFNEKGQERRIQPFYFFPLYCTSYISSEWENYSRLREINKTHPIEQYPYMIFKKQKVQSEKTKYYYRPEQYNAQTMGFDYTDHPLVKQYVSGPATRLWDANYFEMMEYLPMLQFQAYVDPKINKAFDYGGHFTRALQWYDYIKGTWPPAAVLVTALGSPQFGVQQQGALPFQQNIPANANMHQGLPLGQQQYYNQNPTLASYDDNIPF